MEGRIGRGEWVAGIEFGRISERGRGEKRNGREDL
jgi:hypothetical protein